MWKSWKSASSVDPSQSQRIDLTRALGFSFLGWAYLAYAYTLGPVQFRGLTLCPFKWLTGWRCPLCGITHAWNAALHGRWADAFAIHPVAPFLLPVCIAATLWYSLRVALRATDSVHFRVA